MRPETLSDDDGGTQLVDAQGEVVAGTFQKRPVSLRNRDARRVEREPLHVGGGGEPMALAASLPNGTDWGVA